MKLKNCKKGTRVIVKGSHFDEDFVYARGTILQDNEEYPYVSFDCYIEGVYKTFTLEGKFYTNVAAMCLSDLKLL